MLTAKKKRINSNRPHHRFKPANRYYKVIILLTQFIITTRIVRKTAPILPSFQRKKNFGLSLYLIGFIYQLANILSLLFTIVITYKHRFYIH